jgi:flagellin
MSLTINSTNTLTLLNVLGKTSFNQNRVLEQMATGSKINRGADDPAGLLALTKLENELNSVDAGIVNNQRTDAMLSVADNALTEVGNLVSEVQRLASETANDAALTSEEIAANQAQIDDALASIDRIVGSANFNGKKLIDGSYQIGTSLSANTKISDVKVFKRNPNLSSINLTVSLQTAATVASATLIRAGGGGTMIGDGTFSVTGQDGAAVIEYTNGEAVATVATRITDAKAQTGVSAVVAGNQINLYSVETGEAAFARVKAIEGSDIRDVSDSGADAVVRVQGQTTAVDGDHANYSGDGLAISFDILSTMAAGDTVTLTVKDDSTGASGATFQLGTNEQTRATVGIDGVYTAQLGNATDGYLRSLGSGQTNSLLNDPNQAATIAKKAALQVSTLQGRIGGFQKFQVRTSLNSLNDTKESLESAKSIVKDVDYAMASSELNRQNILMQSAMSLLGLANQNSTQVLSLLR